MKEETLRSVLGKLGWDETTVKIQDDHGRLIAVVTSPRFEGMDDGERQHLVWEHVRRHVEPPESANIEFIFTLSPREKERLDRGEELDETQERDTP